MAKAQRTKSKGHVQKFIQKLVRDSEGKVQRWGGRADTKNQAASRDARLKVRRRCCNIFVQVNTDVSIMWPPDVMDRLQINISSGHFCAADRPTSINHDSSSRMF